MRPTSPSTVVYRIAAGPRARVATPFFDGKIEPFTPETLLAGSKLKVGSAYRESKARTASEKLQKFLLQQDRFKAAVEFIAAEPSEDGSTIRPVYRLTVGPPYVIDAVGIKSKQARKEILALLEGQPFDEDLLEQWTNSTAGDAAALRALPGEGHGRGERNGSGHPEGRGRRGGASMPSSGSSSRATPRCPTRPSSRSWSRGRGDCR